MEDEEIILHINEDGSVSAIYDDLLLPLMEQGEAEVTRASNVEPGFGGCWYADMTPVKPGVILGPFRERWKALLAERDWLLRNAF